MLSFLNSYSTFNVDPIGSAGNVGRLSPEHTALYPRRESSSYYDNVEKHHFGIYIPSEFIETNTLQKSVLFPPLGEQDTKVDWSVETIVQLLPNHGQQRY
jgi:hypothetical protein